MPRGVNEEKGTLLKLHPIPGATLQASSQVWDSAERPLGRNKHKGVTGDTDSTEKRGLSLGEAGLRKGRVRTGVGWGSPTAADPGLLRTRPSSGS